MRMLPNVTSTHAGGAGRDPASGQAVVHSVNAVPWPYSPISGRPRDRRRAAAGFPGARAVVLVHPGAALRRRRHRVVRRFGDGRRRRDAVRTARARLRGAGIRRRLFPPPRVAVPALAASRAGRRASCVVRGARAARTRRRRRAAAAMDLRRAAGRRRACCGRSCPCCCNIRSARRIRRRRVEGRAMMRAYSFRFDVTAASAARGSGSDFSNAERDRFHFRRRLGFAGGFWCSLAFAGTLRALLLLAGHRAQAFPDAGGDQPDRDRPDRAESRRGHRPQWCRARAKLLRLHAGDHAVARSRTWTRRSTRSREIVDVRDRDRKRFRKFDGGVEELREPAASHALVRRRGRALRRASLPRFPASRSRRGCSANTRTPRLRRM